MSKIGKQIDSFTAQVTTAAHQFRENMKEVAQSKAGKSSSGRPSALAGLAPKTKKKKSEASLHASAFKTAGASPKSKSKNPSKGGSKKNDAWRQAGLQVPPPPPALSGSARAYYQASLGSAEAYPSSSPQARDVSPEPIAMPMEFPQWPAQHLDPQYFPPQFGAPQPMPPQFGAPQYFAPQHWPLPSQQFSALPPQFEPPAFAQHFAPPPMGFAPHASFNMPWAGAGGPDMTGRPLFPPGFAPAGQFDPFGSFGSPVDFGAGAPVIPFGPAYPSPFAPPPMQGASAAAPSFLPPSAPDSQARVPAGVGSSAPPKAPAMTPPADDMIIPAGFFDEPDAADTSAGGNASAAGEATPIIPVPPPLPPKKPADVAVAPAPVKPAVVTTPVIPVPPPLPPKKPAAAAVTPTPVKPAVVATPVTPAVAAMPPVGNAAPMPLAAVPTPVNTPVVATPAKPSLGSIMGANLPPPTN